MNNKEYRYDAFISYRHCELDSFVAENIHKYLETYNLPKNVKEKLGINGRSIKRIFRDQDELPLSSNLEAPIVEALNNSKYLIVICSPRLKESMWCRKEIETFKKIRGRENIFCVLIEGEPSDSFPEEVLFDYKTVKTKDGKSKKVKELYEPLAADVRGVDHKDVIKKIKSERLRLIAPMFNLNYDDLKQRHRQRKIRKTIFTLSVVAAASFVFAIYSALMLLKISHQQSALKLHQAESLTKESENYLKNDNKYMAIKSSYEALTEFKGVKMPYTTDAEYELCESLNVYNAGISYKAARELNTKGVIDYLKVSNDKKYIITFDESEELNIWRSKDFKKIKTFADLNSFSYSEYSFTFIGSDKVAYVNKKGNISIYDIKKDKVVYTIKKDKNIFMSITTSYDGKYIAYQDIDNLYLYDVENNKVLDKIKLDNELHKLFKFTPDNEYIIGVTNHDALEVVESTNLKIYTFSTKDLSNYKTMNVKADYIDGILFNDNNAYLLLNNSNSISDNNIVVLGFNYKTMDVKFNRVINNAWGTSMNKIFNDKHQNLIIAHSNELILIDANDGKVINTYPLKDESIGIYSFNDNSLYLSFQKNGTVNYINVDSTTMNNVIYNDLYEFNVKEYSIVDNLKTGYLLVPKNSNRVIFYENDVNKELKEVKGKYNILTSEGISIDKFDKVKKEYNVEKKNMVNNIVMGKNKDIVIVNYVDNTANIYSMKTKKKLSTIKNVREISNYIGKDKYGRTYIGNTTDAYILDKDYHKVGHIRNLNSVDKKNNKLIIYKSGKYYSLPIYTLDDLLKIAKLYLK